MNFWLSFIKAFAKRAFVFSLTLGVGASAFYLNDFVNREPETYILKAEIFNLDKPDCSRPNPFTLLIDVDKHQNLSLNKVDSFGSLKYTSELEEKLREIFTLREWNAVYRANTNEVEKQVVVRFDKSIKYGDVVKLIETLNKIGANPVVLDVDKNYCSGGSGGSGNGGLNKAKQHKFSSIHKKSFHKKARRRL